MEFQDVGLITFKLVAFEQLADLLVQLIECGILAFKLVDVLL